MLNFKRVNIASIVFLIVFALFNNIFAFSLWWLIAILIVWLILIIIGSFHIRWNFFLKAQHHNYKVNQNVVALTFDDGPHTIYTSQILNLLEKYNAKATFFLIGKNVEEYPQLANQIISKGHIIGHHSFCHSNDYGFKSVQSIIEDLEKSKEILQETTNLDLKFFRPPFGVTNPNIARVVKYMNFTTFGWSIRSLDTTTKKPTKILNKITSQIGKGDVVLLHDTSEKTVFILEKLLQYMAEKDLKSVTLEQLFNLESYES